MSMLSDVGVALRKDTAEVLPPLLRECAFRGKCFADDIRKLGRMGRRQTNDLRAGREGI